MMEKEKGNSAEIPRDFVWFGFVGVLLSRQLYPCRTALRTAPFAAI